MPAPTEPVTLSAEQVRELKQKISELRHDVNNNVALMLAAVEILRNRPESRESMLDSLSRQPRKISESVLQFSRTLESALKITRPKA